MPSGGARARSGPPPDPNALRRDRHDDPTWRHLPSAGRVGPTPKWPLPVPTKRELALWVEDWRRPQAIMWEANHQEREVAIYVRTFALAEDHEASVPMRTLARQYTDALGLSLNGLRLLRWVIDPAPGADAKPALPRPDEVRVSARARFSVVENAG